ncbi:MAG TPA: hypothetical protein VFI65_04240 [Streptosporangiaceae bacterium]|nr:hypothetical protein [Streptosporangiaceae bacterium]
MEIIGGSWRVELRRLASRQLWIQWTEGDGIQAEDGWIGFARIWRRQFPWRNGCRARTAVNW